MKPKGESAEIAKADFSSTRSETSRLFFWRKKMTMLGHLFVVLFLISLFSLFCGPFSATTSPARV